VIPTLLALVAVTRVATYVPVMPDGRTVAGSCWTRSIAAASRADAYRCMVGNTIYDPCFTLPQRGVVVCDVNPRFPRHGFAIRLTKPLPVEPTFTGAELRPWLVELPGRNVCIPLTGTHAAFGRETIGYECSEPRALMSRAEYTGLLDGGITAGTVWHARKIVYRINRSGPLTGTVSFVPLTAVWR
jgi:hypothetical protein